MELLWRHLPETSELTLVGGRDYFDPGALGTEALLAGFPIVAGRRGRRNRRVVADESGKERVALVGHIPAGLPGLRLPGLELIENLLPAADGHCA